MKYAIWDFDGTLGYRPGMWSGAMIDVLDQEKPNHNVTAKQLQPYLQEGYPWHAPEKSHVDLENANEWWTTLTPVFEQAYEEVGLPSNHAQRLAPKVRSAYLTADKWKLYDDTIPTLESLSANGWTHLILSNHVPELPTLIENVGLSPHITQVFTSATIGYEKPHPQAFQTVLDAIDAIKGDHSIWMIGDSMRADISGAEAAGIPGILVRQSHEDADYCCENLSGVPLILETNSTN